MSDYINKNYELKSLDLEIKSEKIFNKNENCDYELLFDSEKTFDIDHVEQAEKEFASISGIIGKIVDIFDGETKDGKIGDTKQGQTGDCYLLSAINALSYTEKGRELIKDALDYQEDGSVIVHLQTGDVVITQEEINKTKGSLEYSSGDDDMIIFELAIEKTMNDIHSGKIKLPNECDAMKSSIDGNIDGGYPELILYMLTGQFNNSTWQQDDKWDILNYFNENQGKDFAATATITNRAGDEENRKVKDINGNEITLAGDHAYAIKSVDEDSVTVINPWDSSKEIVLSKEVFMETFDLMEYADMSNKNKYEKWISEQDKNREIISGIRYTNDYEYDKNGNVTEKRIHTDMGIGGIRYTYDKNGNVKVNLYDVDENGNIIDKYEITEEQAQKILERGLLDTKEESNIGAGLANDIYTSELWNVSDEKWKILEDYFLNISSERINLQILSRFAKLDIEDIDKALYELAFNKELPPEILYLKLSGQWTEEEFQNYLEKNDIEYKTYEEIFGRPYEYTPPI